MCSCCYTCICIDREFWMRSEAKSVKITIYLLAALFDRAALLQAPILERIWYHYLPYVIATCNSYGLSADVAYTLIKAYYSIDLHCVDYSFKPLLLLGKQWWSPTDIEYSVYYCSTCIQVPRFSFREKQISGLEWGSNLHTHISSVMLYQLSYQAPGSKLVGRKGIHVQVLVLGAHYIRN